jgi:hypothetical protein
MSAELSQRHEPHIGRALTGTCTVSPEPRDGARRCRSPRIGVLARDTICKQQRDSGVAVEECLRRLRRHKSRGGPPSAWQQSCREVHVSILRSAGGGIPRSSSCARSLRSGRNKARRSRAAVCRRSIDCWPALGRAAEAPADQVLGVIGTTCSRAPTYFTGRCGSLLAGIKTHLAHPAVAARADLSTSQLDAPAVVSSDWMLHYPRPNGPVIPSCAPR